MGLSCRSKPGKWVGLNCWSEYGAGVGLGCLREEGGVSHKYFHSS